MNTETAFPNANSPWKQGLRWVLAVLFILGAIATIIGIPVVVSQAFKLNAATTVLIGLAIAALLMLLVFLAGFGTYKLNAYFEDLRLESQDVPPNGFNNNEAQLLCKMACRTLPNLPSRKRNILVLAVGLSLKFDAIQRSLRHLEFFAHTRLDSVAYEVRSERKFSNRTIERVAGNVLQSVTDLEYYVQSEQDWISDLEHFNQLPSHMFRRITQASELVRRVGQSIDELASDFETRVAPAEVELSNEQLVEKKRLVEMFEGFAKQLDEARGILIQVHVELTTSCQDCTEKIDIIERMFTMARVSASTAG